MSLSTIKVLPEARASSPLPTDPRLLCGTLPNGFRFVLRHNEYPHNTIAAYLEINVGSLNERGADEMTEEDIAIGLNGEQGLAHVLEHCVFLGTEAYEHDEDLRAELTSLGMSWGGDSNAYTDYRSTVYTLEAPYMIGDAEVSPRPPEAAAGVEVIPVSSKDPIDLARTNVPKLLHILHQLAFKATFPEILVEREKVAVLSEAAMRNTTEYRVEVAMTAQTQAENLLPHRLPIGLTSVVKNATVEHLRHFYKRWYRPEYMTLYVVGPFGGSHKDASIAPDDLIYKDVLQLITRVFGAEGGTAPTPNPVIWRNHINHIVSFPNPQPKLVQYFDQPASQPIIVAQSPLLSRFSMSLQQKRPTAGYQVHTYGDFARGIIDLLAASIFESRINALRNTFSVPPFSSIELDDGAYSDQSCAMRGLHISADLTADDGLAHPAESRWFKAIVHGFTEAIRFHEYGVLPNELHLASAAMVKDFRDSANAEESASSDDVLSGMQQCVYDSCTATSRAQDLRILNEILPHITIEMVSARAKELTAFVRELAESCLRWLLDIEEGNATLDQVFRHLPMNMSIFLCAPGPEDTISKVLPPTVAIATAPTDTPAAISGIVAKVGPPAGFQLGPSALTSDETMDGSGPASLGTPTLIDRLRQVSSRRAKLVRMISHDSAEDEHAGDADAQDEGDDAEEDGEEAVEEADGHGHVEGGSLLPYEINALHVLQAIASSLVDIKPPQDIRFPLQLLTDAVLEQRAHLAQEEHARASVPYGLMPWKESATVEYHDVDSDAFMLRCSNGLTVCYKKTSFEANLVDMTVVARGGKDGEGPSGWRCGFPAPADAGRVQPGPSALYPTFTYGPLRAPADDTLVPCGATDMGLKTMFHSGAGSHSADELLRYCMLWGLSVSSTVAQDSLQFVLSGNTAPVPDSSGATSEPPTTVLTRLFELLHLYIMDCQWEETAFHRAKDETLADLHHIPLSLERSCFRTLMKSTFADNRRFLSPETKEAAAIPLAKARRAILEQLTPPNIQVTIVGDFDPAQVRGLTEKYLACLLVRSSESPVIAPTDSNYPLIPLPYVTPRTSTALTSWHEFSPGKVSLTGTLVTVSEQHHRAYLAISVPILGKYEGSECPPADSVSVLTADGRIDRTHPLFLYRCANLWNDVLNNRLYRRLRDAVGACYSVSFTSSPLEFTTSSLGVVAATPIPSMAGTALIEAIRVLQGVFHVHEPLTAKELEEAKKPLVQSVRTSLRTNAAWHSLLTFINGHRSRKSWASIHGVLQFYENVTLEDVLDALNRVMSKTRGYLPLHAIVGYTGDFQDIAGKDPKLLMAGSASSTAAELFQRWLKSCAEAYQH